MSIDFQDLEKIHAEGGKEALLDRLIDELRQQRKFGELFEALKMRVRGQAGLPWLYSDNGDDLNEAQQETLEKGLLDACREVGTLLMKHGQIREGWMYLQPVGDRAAVVELLGELDPDDDSLEEMIDVCVHQGVDVERGFGLVLEHYGTCNAITTFESIIYGRPKDDQQKAARLLVQHVHDELATSLKADIAQQQGEAATETTIADLVADRDWLFGEYSYHIDTTHLASTVRFARLCDDEATMKLALDLTAYGRLLSEQFQYDGDEPFLDQYPSHALYFQALLGIDVEEGLAYFLEKAKTIDAREWSTIAIDIYVDLLARLGRYQEAIAAAIELTPDDARPSGQGPSLLELSQDAEDFTSYLDYCRKNQDLLGFATGLLVND